ncbi:DNA primase small subunit-like [Leptopilina boulardi]|uniref:DNA primase small subunit-like n=1 Tax=Leptopilina boulardi TaxID=63433 RepID=UPI0021F56222|nr:DNA primase small subunit-like [Leptopilina boulardi]
MTDGQRLFYYQDLFPFEDCCRWLSYCNGYILSLREFTLSKDDKPKPRNSSFHNALEMKINAKRICPKRIDVGAIYNLSPRLVEKKLFNFFVTQREMIFDIDISDYTDVRNCCSESGICRKCWKYMATACKILDTTLRDDFAFKHILWIYSGNRGIHCWICDENARKLRIDDRRAIACYLQIVKPGAFNAKRVKLNGKPHHSIKRALEIIEENFVDICIVEQNYLGTQEGIEKFLKTFLLNCNKEMRENLREIFQKYKTSLERWIVFENFIKETNEWENNFEIEEIKLQFLYPRIDDPVTTDMRHLLRLPFSPHNKTNKICLPFDPKKVDDFDPLTSPDYSSLYKEQQFKNDGINENLENLEKFQQSISIFHEFVNNLEKYEQSS